MEKRLEPIIDVIRKIEVCIFIEEGGVPDTVKCLGEIQTVDNNIIRNIMTTDNHLYGEIRAKGIRASKHCFAQFKKNCITFERFLRYPFFV